MELLKSVKELLETGDPTIRSWFLVESLWPPFTLCALYVFLVTRLGPALMRRRRPFDLRLPMIAYNFVIVAAYAYAILKLLYYVLTTDCAKRLCTPTVVIPGDCAYECCSAGYIIYILKYVEFADTMFFIMRKKFHLITNLHVVHHTALPIICWVLMRTERSGFQFIPAGINAFVHIIMYTYYGLAAMGPDMQKILWWKKYLTLLQMTQFVVILLFMLVVVPLSGCRTSTHGIYIIMFFATLFLLLFYNFYKKTYKKSRSATPAVKGASETYHGNETAHQKDKGINGTAENGVYHMNGIHPKES